uniref:Uncharacterized protein n=1 Tax=Mycena chlorophos TaxID=658473 RepID=A0ABQ0LIR2_MYCCL|nr:predicted protein [Mycena chlorophos]
MVAPRILPPPPRIPSSRPSFRATTSACLDYHPRRSLKRQETTVLPEPPRWQKPSLDSHDTDSLSSGDGEDVCCARAMDQELANVSLGSFAQRALTEASHQEASHPLLRGLRAHAGPHLREREATAERPLRIYDSTRTKAPVVKHPSTRSPPTSTNANAAFSSNGGRGMQACPFVSDGSVHSVGEASEVLRLARRLVDVVAALLCGYPECYALVELPNAYEGEGGAVEDVGSGICHNLKPRVMVEPICLSLSGAASRQRRAYPGDRDAAARAIGPSDEEAAGVDGLAIHRGWDARALCLTSAKEGIRATAMQGHPSVSQRSESATVKRHLSCKESFCVERWHSNTGNGYILARSHE